MSQGLAQAGPAADRRQLWPAGG